MRGLPLVLALLAPVAALVVFQGMVTVGLVPLAVFGPFYVLARGVLADTDEARAEGARMVVTASVGGGLALAPALYLLAQGPLDPGPSLGLFLIGASLGGLAGLATAPKARDLSPREERKWTIVRAVTQDHGQGLVRLFFVAVPVVLALVLFREAPLFTAEDGSMSSLPGALFGQLWRGGYIVLPGANWPVILAVPLSLAPLAIGFLAPMRQGTSVALGGVAALAMIPLAVTFDLPVVTPGGLEIPLSLRPEPAVEALAALAPIGAGALLAAGALSVFGASGSRTPKRTVWWAATGALVAAVGYGVVPTLALLLGLGLASVLLGLQARRSPTGAALAGGALAGLVLSFALADAQAMLAGALVGLVAVGAAVTASTTRALPLPSGSLRSPRTLVYLAVALVFAGVLAWLASGPMAAGTAPFRAPHARALHAGLSALIHGQGFWLLAWGVAAGLVVQVLTGQGVLAALGFLAGPGTALMVFLGSLARSFWESHLFERARKGFVRRGEMGYELLRTHVLVVAILAAEAIGVALSAWIEL